MDINIGHGNANAVNSLASFSQLFSSAHTDAGFLRDTTRKHHPLPAYAQTTTDWESRDMNNVSVLEHGSVFAVHGNRTGLRFQWAPLLKSSHVRVFDCFSLDGTCLSTRDRVIRR